MRLIYWRPASSPDRIACGQLAGSDLERPTPDEDEATQQARSSGAADGVLVPPRNIHSRGECFTFVSGLEEVATIIDNLVAVEPARAVALYEAFLAGCHAKTDELDDSSGSFGQFARDLICRWIKSRQAADVEPRMTASTLLAWMDDDPYGFCYQIEKDAAAAFDKAGLAAFEKQIRERFDTVSADPSSWAYRRGADILRAIYIAQRDIEAYIALTEQTKLKLEDCLAIAKLVVPRDPNKALFWVERGRALDRESQFRSTAAYDLDKLHRELLSKLGREDEALEAAWAGRFSEASLEICL